MNVTFVAATVLLLLLLLLLKEGKAERNESSG